MSYGIALTGLPLDCFACYDAALSLLKPFCE
jgi:hypothetical protein